MVLLNLQAQVGQVQSLLATLQDNLNHPSLEIQNRVCQDLEHIVSELRDWTYVDSRSLLTTTIPLPTNMVDTESPLIIGTREPWVSYALRQGLAGAWKWDMVRNNSQWSPELFELLGFGLEDDISDPQLFINMILLDDREAKIQEMEEAIRRGGPFYAEFRVKTKDGRVIWITSAGTVDVDSEGRPIQAAGISQDITAHKQAEEALRAAEARERASMAEMQALMDAVPALIWISRDPECKQMVGNRFGYEFVQMWEGANLSRTAPDADLSQQPYRTFKDGKELATHEMPMQIAAATGVGTSNYEFDLVFENGTIKNLLGNIIPLLDPDGNPSGAVGAFIDITGRKQAEEELRQSEANERARAAELTAIINAVPAPILLTRDPQGKKIEGNLATYQLLGIPVGTDLTPILYCEGDTPIQGFYHEGKLVPFQDYPILAALFTGETVKDYEGTLVFKDGRVVALLGNAIPLRGEDGKSIGSVSVFIDVTERLAAERALRESDIRLAAQSRLLETREKERAKIAREIHDGPIQTIVGAIFEIQGAKEVVTDQEAKAEIELIGANLKSAIHELRQIINELRPPTLARFGLLKTLKKLVEEVQEKKADAEFILDLPEEMEEPSQQISLTVYRICQEALHNIVRHSEANRAFIQLSEDPITLVIQDNGKGFSPVDDFSNLAENNHFGLVGMKERTEALGGSFQVISEPGKGTVIRMMLPGDVLSRPEG